MTKNYILNYIRDNKVKVTLGYEQAQFNLSDEEDIVKKWKYAKT